MKKRLVLVFAVMTVITVAACDSKKTITESAVPMLAGISGGPWPVETYLGEKVQVESARLNEEGQMEKYSSTVYIDSKSRFVYRDGSPIKTVKGDDIYWNQAGIVITKELKRVPESSIFTVKGAPMKPGTAMVPMIPHIKPLGSGANGWQPGTGGVQANQEQNG